MFEIGQQVVCINNVWWNVYPDVPNLPHNKSVYTIRGFDEVDTRIYGIAYLYFVELKNPIVQGFVREPAFISRYFRPVRKTSIEIFTTLLAPTPKQKVLT